MDKPLKIIIGIILIAIIGGAIYFYTANKNVAEQNEKVEYKNDDYRFSFDLPETWRGYKVTIEEWTGDAIGDQLGEVHYTSGPVVSIHNPKETVENTYQNIPIMIFTLNQWSDLQNDKFHIGAAPIGPTELGRNTRYVFALPARYNFAFPQGFEEVEQILNSHPLKTF